MNLHKLILFSTLVITSHIRAQAWGTFEVYTNFMSNKSLYVDGQSKEPARFGFDLELNMPVNEKFYIGVAAEGAGKPFPGFTQVAGRLTLNYQVSPNLEVYGYHRSAHNLDRGTYFPKYGFSNDNHVGLRVKFGKDRN